MIFLVVCLVESADHTTIKRLLKFCPLSNKYNNYNYSNYNYGNYNVKLPAMTAVPLCSSRMLRSSSVMLLPLFTDGGH